MVADFGIVKAESLLALPEMAVWEVLFTPNGRSMLVRTVGDPGSRDVWMASLDSLSQLKPLLTTPANEVAPALSPAGRWLAYGSDESGQDEVYVRSFPGMEERCQVSRDGGAEPVWSPRGGELFYRSGPLLMAAEFRAATGFDVIRRTPLFSDASYFSDGTHAVYRCHTGRQSLRLGETPRGRQLYGRDLEPVRQFADQGQLQEPMRSAVAMPGVGCSRNASYRIGRILIFRKATRSPWSWRPMTPSAALP